jgi:glycerol-3-phosphate acyltransferase PlsY
MEKIILIYLVAYLAGSINFAIIFFKLAGKADPRLSFSGNAGTTNVYRQAGYFWATVILLLDIGRAVGVAALALHFLEGKYLPWAGFFLVLGNSFPCFHNFRGGKGVANYLGFTLLIEPWAALLAAIMWVATYGVYRITFVASFVMVFILAIGHAFSNHWVFCAVTGAGATFFLILFNHRKNIIKYWSGDYPITPSDEEN